MEIQKIFSNVEDPEENFYSVLMDEDEMYLFSEFQKEFNSKAQKARKRKWEIENGIRTANLDKHRADFASSFINYKKGGNPDLGINKPVSADEIAVNLARENNKYLSRNDILKEREKDLRDARKLYPKATFNDTARDSNWALNFRELKYKKAKDLAEKKRAEEILKKKRLAKKVALGTAAVVGTGIAAKKIYDKKKNKEKE